MPIYSAVNFDRLPMLKFEQDKNSFYKINERIDSIELNIKKLQTEQQFAYVSTNLSKRHEAELND